MKKPVVDYRQFRLRKINEPRFSHLKLLLGWVWYFLMYLLTENLIPAEKCHAIHCALDYMIPFNELFLLIYVGWYVLVAGSLLYFALYNIDSFKKLSIYILITQIVAMATYIIYPSRQDLRPLFFERDNLLTRLMGFIYAFDTPTGVCPSLHVAYSLAIASVFTKEKAVSRGAKAAIWAFCLLVCPAVLFVKQHSAVDVIAALPVVLLGEVIVYGKYWRNTWRKKRRL